MTIPTPDLMESLAKDLETEVAGASVELTQFPSGGAMLDVRRSDGRLFVMAYTPTHGFGVDEVQAHDGFVTGYQFVYPDFLPAARKLRSLSSGP